MNTLYKGFTITNIDGRFVLDSGKSYATEAAAKVAISKAEKAAAIIVVQKPSGLSLVRTAEQQTESAIAAAQQHAQSRAIVVKVVAPAKAIKVAQSRNKREGKFAGVICGRSFRTNKDCRMASAKIKGPNSYKALDAYLFG